MDAKDIKIFLIEDDPDQVTLIQETLNQAAGTSKITLEFSDRLIPGLARVAKGGIDVLLLDLSLPDSKGLETFTRAHTQLPGVPIIVLTGLDDKTVGLEALWQGAQDYLIKGRVDGKMLLRVIRYAIQRNRMQAEMRSQSLTE